MNITSVQYKNSLEGVQDNIVAVIDGVKMQIPIDPANRHYAEILRQVEEGVLTIQEA
jgi:hypothetical protein